MPLPGWPGDNIKHIRTGYVCMYTIAEGGGGGRRVKGWSSPWMLCALYVCKYCWGIYVEQGRFLV